MKKWIKQITEWEIYEIRILLKEWYSIPQTARKVWRNKSTIYRLLKNNWVEYNQTKYRSNWYYLREEWKRKIQFHPRTVFLKRKIRKSVTSRRYCRIEIWSKVEWFILEKIKEYYSPKQISWRRKLENYSPLSKDTIYSYIYNNYPELISKYFRRKGKKYQNKRKQKYQLDQRRMIDKRPKSIEKRTTLGHWEADTVVGKRKTRTKNVF